MQIHRKSDCNISVWTSVVHDDSAALLSQNQYLYFWFVTHKEGEFQTTLGAFCHQGSGGMKAPGYLHETDIFLSFGIMYYIDERFM